MPVLVVGSLRSVRADAGRLRATHVLSILDPGTPAPDLFMPHGRHVVLNVEDVQDAGTAERPGPDEAFVAAVIAFARSVPEDGRVVVHCHAGRSRSPAAAILMLSEWGLEPVLPGVAAFPNERILAIAEALTGRPLLKAGEAARRLAAQALLLAEDASCPRSP